MSDYYTLVECSPKAAMLISDEAKIAGQLDAMAQIGVGHKANSLYPTARQRVGMSFKVPLDKQENSLRVYFSKKGKKENRKYAVIKHKEFNCYEVARIA